MAFLEDQKLKAEISVFHFSFDIANWVPANADGPQETMEMKTCWLIRMQTNSRRMEMERVLDWFDLSVMISIVTDAVGLYHFF